MMVCAVVSEVPHSRCCAGFYVILHWSHSPYTGEVILWIQIQWMTGIVCS